MAKPPPQPPKQSPLPQGAATRPAPAPPPPPPAPPKPLHVITGGDNQNVLCQAEPFNSGSEGRLYFTLDGKYVVKLYSQPEVWRQKSLELIIQKRAEVMGEHRDYWSIYFCWPEAEIVQPSLGMIMRRAAPDLRPLSHLLSPRFRQRLKQESGPAALGSWIGHIGIMIKLARTVSRLHNCGLCHSDLSPNNLLVNPSTGNSTLIDCDGLVELGSSVLLPTVLGTPDYMAPELVMGLMPRPGMLPPQPTVESDLHSLAVLIYQGLLFRHPLRGSAFHSPDPDEDERLMLGQRALYIEHPTDTSNRPKTPFLKSNILGEDFQELCTRAFIDGLHQPAKRPKAAEWERVLVRLADQTIPCSNPDCEAKNFILIEGGAARCPWCRTEVKGPRTVPILYFYRPRQGSNSSSPTLTTHTLDFRFVGWHGRKLHLWHLEPNRLPGPNVDVAPFGEFLWEAANRQEHWYLLNQGIKQIQDITDGQHAITLTAPKIELRAGMKLKFLNGDKQRVVDIRLSPLL